MLCPGTVWLRPHVELIVRYCGGRPWESPPGRGCGSRGGATALLHLFHAGQVPWVKAGAEHHVTEAGLHYSVLRSPLLPPPMALGSEQASSLDADGLFLIRHIKMQLWINICSHIYIKITDTGRRIREHKGLNAGCTLNKDWWSLW